MNKHHLVLLILLSFTLVFTGCSESEKNETTSSIPKEIQGQWRLTSYAYGGEERSTKTNEEIAVEAEVGELHAFLIDAAKKLNHDTANVYASLLFVEPDSLVVFAHHCSGEGSGSPRFVYQVEMTGDTLFGDSLSFNLSFSEYVGENESTEPIPEGTVQRTTTLELLDKQLVLTQYQTFKYRDSTWTSVLYFQNIYHRFEHDSITINSEGTCADKPNAMPFPEF